MRWLKVTGRAPSIPLWNKHERWHLFMSMGGRINSRCTRLMMNRKQTSAFNKKHSRLHLIHRLPSIILELKILVSLIHTHTFNF